MNTMSKSLRALERELEQLTWDRDRFQQDIATLTKWIAEKQSAIEDVEQQIAALNDSKFKRKPRQISAALRQRIFYKANWTCQYCGVTNVPLVIDHDIPVARGGTNKAQNLVSSCEPCNRSKGTMTGDEFRKSLEVVS